MSVYSRMFGRHLPCSTLDLLQIPVPQATAQDHEQRTRMAQLGRAGASELYQLGLFCLLSQEPGLARRWLTEALGINRTPACQLALAAACEMLAQHDQAAAHIDAVLAQFQFNTAADSCGVSRPTLLGAAGFAWERSGNWQRAAQRYNTALLQNPGNAFAARRLVAIHLAHGQRTEATVQLRSILTHNPADLPARICLAHLLQLDGLYDQAIWEYQQALCLEPDGWEMPLDMARHFQSISSDQAIDVLEQMVVSQPHFPDLRMRLANLYSLQGNDQSARQEYRRALSLHPEYLECHIALARHELRMGRAELAAEHFRDAITINNQHVEVYVGLAMAQYQAARHAQAAETLDSAARIANNSAVLLAQLGFMDMDLANHGGNGSSKLTGTELRTDWTEQLIASCETALADHPTWNDLRVEQGMLLRLLGRKEEALDVLMQAIRCDADERNAWLQLGLVLTDLTQAAKATQAFANALTLETRWAELQYRLALIYCGELEFDLTLEKLEKSTPIDAQRKLWLAIGDLRLSRPQEAVETERAGIAALRE